MDTILESCKRIFEKSPRPFGIAHVCTDEHGNPTDATISYLNPTMAALADATPDELQGRNIYEIWADGDRTWLHNLYRAACLGESVEFETVSVDYQQFQNVVLIPLGNGYCGYEVQDVTSWLTYSNSDPTNASAGVFFYEPRQQLMLLTDSAQDCCHLRNKYFTVRDFADQLFEPEAANRVNQAFVDASHEGDHVFVEEQSRSGTWLRLSMTYASSSTRFSNGLLEDITLLKKAENQSARYSEIIESLSAEYYALHLVDLDTDTMKPYLIRNKVGRYFAADVEQASSYTDWLRTYCERYVVGADKDKLLKLLNREALLQHLSEGSSDFSVVCKRLFDGVEQYIELRLIMISSDPRTMLIAACNINDEVKKRIDQNEALQTALTLANNASEAKTTFLTNISHDLRTPLNSIMGFTDLALSHVDNAASVKNDIERIKMSSEHLLDLINELLDVSRIESGKEVLNETPIDLRQLVFEVEAVFSAQAEDCGLDFSIDTSHIKHPHVFGDQLRINQIFANTIGNALKYTSVGGSIDVTVAEQAVSHNNRAMFEITIKDTGRGMSEDFLQRIFLPFERAKADDVRATEGTGLGMTITKNIISLMGGTIQVKSKLGEGTEFKIMLPLRLDKKYQAQKDVPLDQPTQSTSISGKRILVVDDDDLSREMMEGILEDKGCEVKTANDGDVAVEMVQASEEGYFDAIIMDMRMPRMPGDEATRAIRTLPRHDVASMLIISLTADAFEEGHRRFSEAGVTAHLTKPLNTRLLMEVLEKHLG